MGPTVPRAASPPSSSVRQPNVLWRRINDRIEQRMVVIERAVVALLERPLRPPEVQTCEAEARLLARWLFALDLVVAGRLAREIAETFATPDLTNRDAAALSARVDDLRRVLRLAADDWTSVEPGATHIHVVSPIDARIDAMMWHLQQQGSVVTHSPTFLSAPENADSIVVYSPTDVRDTRPLLVGIGRRSAATQRIVLHAGAGDGSDLTGVSPHADLILPYEVEPKVLAEEIHAISQPRPDWLDRVVLLGADHLYRDLVPYGFTGRIATTTGEAMDALRRSARTLLVSHGIREPEAVVSLVRATPSTRDCIVAAVDVDSATATRCRQAGADVVVEGQESADHWALHLRGLCIRRRTLPEPEEARGAEIPHWSRATVVIERALASLGRTGGRASLAVMSVPNDLPSAELDRIRHALTSEFRRDDLLGQIDDRTFAVLLKGAPRSPAITRMGLALSHLGVPEVPGRVGVAEFPGDGVGLNNLLEAADAAATRASDGQGPAVVGSDWFADSPEATDVLLVESDPTLATVLEQLLGQLDLTSRRVSTGSEALRVLTGTRAAPVPRLVILELDAMGADGLMIMRSLARAGILGRARVIVTCSRVRDGELREAFELGAVDVIRKPFSAVVLTNRIRRILQS